MTYIHLKDLHATWEHSKTDKENDKNDDTGQRHFLYLTSRLGTPNLSDPTCSIVVIRVNLFQTELMVEICSESS